MSSKQAARKVWYPTRAQLGLDKAGRPLHFDMSIEDGTPLALVPHLMPDDHYSHGILLPLVRSREDPSGSAKPVNEDDSA
jgi:hypothetical protein